MKKKIISIILALSIVFSGASAIGASAASDFGDTMTNIGVGALEVVIRGILEGICAMVPDSINFKKVKDHVAGEYTGTKEWNNEVEAGAKWSLGYAKASLVPAELKEALENGEDYEGEYYLGGFMTLDNGMNNKVEELVDDMQVRVIAISDGDGISVYANVDCIGFCHGDLVTVRKYFQNYGNKNIDSVNLTSTHCHSCLDTQGLWTNGLPKILGNMAKSYLPFLQKTKGANYEWLDWACKEIAKAMDKAVNDMEDGTMTYAVKTLDDAYFNNKNRKSSTSLNCDMSRFIFTPNKKSAKPTMIVNIAAHPDVTGLATSDPLDNGRQISGDYVYWMGDTIEKENYNFMFFNGAIAGIYYSRGESGDGLDLERRYMQAQRFGQEMGQIALNLTNDYDTINAKYGKEIADTIAAEKIKNPSYDEGSYTIWYKDWKPTTERKLDPIFNLKMKEVKIEVNNPLIKLVGKLELVNYEVYKENLKYYMYSEIGIAQFGDVMVAMMPGEVVQDLVYGGASLTAEGSFKGKDFGYKTICELFGDDTVVFGLCNDAIGYVVPDNDYSLGIVDDHYQELISLGDKTASSILQGFAELKAEIPEKQTHFN